MCIRDRPNPFLEKIGAGKLSRQNVPQNAILASAATIAFAAFIKILPGVSDSFALITASSSGVYIAIYGLTMLALSLIHISPCDVLATDWVEVDD